MAALVSLPIVGGVVIGLLNLLRSLGGDAAGSDRPSVGARLAMGLPAAAYVGWLVGFGYAYSTGAVMPDWRHDCSKAGNVPLRAQRIGRVSAVSYAVPGSAVAIFCNSAWAAAETFR